MPEPMSRRRLLAYGLGNAGFQITDRIVVSLAVYFYLPPAGRGLETQVSPRIFLGFLTVYGLAMLVGRLFDSAADPIVGHASDRSRSPLGRRRSFLIYGIGPMVAAPVLIFFPPGAPESALNAAWLTGLLAVYFVAFTLYVAPYLALIPELAWSAIERVRLSRLLAVVGFPVGVGFGTMWTLGFDLGRDAGLDPATALRTVVIAASLLAFVLCVAPILAVDERRFAHSVPSDLSFREAFVATLANGPFRLYLVAQLAFLFGVNLVQPALPYLATVVLGREEGFAAYLGLATFGGVGLGFAALPPLIARIGPKRSMLASLLLFGLSVGCFGAMRADVPGGPHDVTNLALAFGVSLTIGIPVAGLLVLPNVLIGQLVDYDEAHTGANRAAMYYGVQGFLTKWVYGVSLWAFTFLLARFGASPDAASGVLLVGPVAAVTCLLSIVVYARYPEREVLERAGRGDGTA